MGEMEVCHPVVTAGEGVQKVTGDSILRDRSRECVLGSGLPTMAIFQPSPTSQIGSAGPEDVLTWSLHQGPCRPLPGVPPMLQTHP